MKIHTRIFHVRISYYSVNFCVIHLREREWITIGAPTGIQQHLSLGRDQSLATAIWIMADCLILFALQKHELAPNRLHRNGIS